MQDFTRYAVYYAPEPGPLGDFGARWLGWDSATGQPRANPDIPGLPLPVEEITRTPHKYGLHGTIKPPFALAPGSDPDTLSTDLAALCRNQAPITLDSLHLTRLGGFLALIPQGDTSTLSDLAAKVVKTLDHHRAPPSEAELTKRRAKRLSPAQDNNLLKWGYPYVLDDFRFHMTLTGRLSRVQADIVVSALTPYVTPLLPAPLVIRDLCLFGEAPDGHFHLLSRHPLGD